MKFCVCMGSPRAEGNTAALLAPFLEECRALGVEAHVISLHNRAVKPCLGCMTCQDCLEGPGCVQNDGFEEIFQAMADSDVIVLATPIYSFFCKRLAAVVTCGYPPERGADLWEEGLKRFCRHGGLEYMGILCRQDRGGAEPFMNEDRAQAARDFAQALVLAVRADRMAGLE